MLQYVQIVESKIKIYEIKYNLLTLKYFNESKKFTYSEFHFDSYEEFLNKIGKETEYCGNLSVLFGKFKLTNNRVTVHATLERCGKNTGIRVGDFISLIQSHLEMK